MANRSRYDELHDRYHTIATTKSGTRYERLAALVLKALKKEDIIIHDLRLSGCDPDVKHQIDVTVEEPGRRVRRLLIECKDFDSSGKSVGIGVVRSFRSIVEDTGATEGIVLTCNDFTTQAKKYATSKGIKLCVLRLSDSADMVARIQQIVLTVVADITCIERAMVLFGEIEGEVFANRLKMARIGSSGICHTDPVVFVKDDKEEQFCSFLTNRVTQPELWKITPQGRLAMPANGWRIQIQNMAPIVFQGIFLDVLEERDREVLNIVSNRVAELILSGFGDEDLIIFGDQLERFKINPESGVVEKSP